MVKIGKPQIVAGQGDAVTLINKWAINQYEGPWQDLASFLHNDKDTSDIDADHVCYPLGVYGKDIATFMHV